MKQDRVFWPLFAEIPLPLGEGTFLVEGAVLVEARLLFAEIPLPLGEGGPFGFAQGKLRPGEGRRATAEGSRHHIEKTTLKDH